MTTIGANLVCRLQEGSASPGQISYDDPTLAFGLLSTSRRIFTSWARSAVFAGLGLNTSLSFITATALSAKLQVRSAFGLH